MVDPARRVGDGFIVVSTTGDIAVAGAASRSATDGEADPGAAEGRNTREPSSEAAAGPGLRPAGVSPNLLEGATNTAVGAGALAQNTTGLYNTAGGYQALYDNTTGSR